MKIRYCISLYCEAFRWKYLQNNICEVIFCSLYVFKKKIEILSVNGSQLYHFIILYFSIDYILRTTTSTVHRSVTPLVLCCLKVLSRISVQGIYSGYLAKTILIRLSGLRFGKLKLSLQHKKRHSDNCRTGLFWRCSLFWSSGHVSAVNVLYLEQISASNPLYYWFFMHVSLLSFWTT